jgi:branched-chain amino acid transport system ATP-binding protein
MLLEISSLHVRYGAINAISDISLKIDEGEIVCLIGANGAGKSTLLNAISGVVQPAQGTIVFQGERIERVRPEQIVRRRLIQVPEGRQVFGNMTVAENLMLGAYTCRTAKLDQALEVVYQLFPRLYERKAQAAGSLSGGEQQMLAIGRALMSQPKLLLLDEPSMGLAPLVIETIFSALKELNRSGMSMLLVEQNAGVALKLSDRAYVMATGHIVLEGPSAGLMQDSYVREAFLGRGAGRKASAA